ncbi:unnamed protein product, partial [Schistosoma turkestanicum]
ELFENNQNEARSGTSWSSFEQVMSPHRNISMLGRGSVNQLYPAPIFPTNWHPHINTLSNNDQKADDLDMKERTSASFIHSTPQNRRVEKTFCPDSNSPSSTSVFSLTCDVSNDSGYHNYQSQYESLLLSSAHPPHSMLSK